MNNFNYELLAPWNETARAATKVSSDLDILALTYNEVRGDLCAEFDEQGADLVFYTKEVFEKSTCLFSQEVRGDGVLLWKN